MLVNNFRLTGEEKSWLEMMLTCNFPGKSEVIRQINSARIDRNYTNTYLSIKFYVDELEAPANVKVRVPVEMRVYKRGETPIQFLIHVVSGYVNELEVFHADSSYLSHELKIEGAEVEFVIA